MRVRSETIDQLRCSKSNTRATVQNASARKHATTEQILNRINATSPQTADRLGTRVRIMPPKHRVRKTLITRLIERPGTRAERKNTEQLIINELGTGRIDGTQTHHVRARATN